MAVQRAMTRDEVREVDRRAIEDLAIPEIVLMENAGRGAAEIILNRFEAELGRGCAIVCGGGNNGGDGFVVARHLANHGAKVTVFLVCDATRLTESARVNHEIVRRMGLELVPFGTQGEQAGGMDRLNSAGVIVDALLGTGFRGEVRPGMAAAIEAINKAPGAVVALDVPSGMECDTGRGGNATVKARLTVTFVAPKVGFERGDAARFLGEVCVVNIGVPPSILPA